MKERLQGRIKVITNELKNRDLYPDIRVIEGRSTGREVTINGKKTLLFCGYDYLGLSSNEEVISEQKKALDEYGTQTGGTPLVSGTLDIHKSAEKQVAELVGKEQSLLLTSGALANIGVIPALMSAGNLSLGVKDYLTNLFRSSNNGVIFSDELNHATIVDGCRLSKARIVVFKHKDIDDLRKKLRAHNNFKWKLIVTDGVFSMDGDIAPLDKLAEIAEENSAWLMVDDAHAVGVLGKDGGGTPSYFGVENKVDIVTGALGKAISVVGGYVTTSSDLAEYFRVSVRPAIFSGSLPPPVTFGLIKSIDIIKSSAGGSLRSKLHRNAILFRQGLKDKGFDTLSSEDPVPIIPLLVGDDRKAIKFSRALEERGIFAPAIRWPAVSKETARIRFTVQSNQSEEDIERTLIAVEELDREFALPKQKV